MGSFDSARSTWHKVKAFPRNVEMEVAATYSGGGGRFFGNDSVNTKNVLQVLPREHLRWCSDCYEPALGKQC